ncbi:hypothetical protein PHLGIDRAFT_193285 [Phlebiopsis gigantea 11061_1 CR5-6]|uniref:Cytochrome P450 n=1 Tax=Phlebiopsis gigantea (strain 11061_1 CR5-6) TaxID=745531 RepID=A0A0C3NHY5_PHLG1|nr:hypothetical protein PHLGIDRAFT_193285 [Phlebiopsis gigantea 11061_1 CR5-6]
MAGDTAAALYLLAFGGLYTALRYSATFSPHVVSTSLGLTCAYTLCACATTAAYRLSPWHPLADMPGPRAWHLSSLWFSYVSYKGRRHLILDALHAQYGPFLRVGPDTISVNSPGAQHIYSGAAHMPKSESYRAPGHKRQVAMFFKQPSERLHTERKRVWSGLFTKDGVSQLLPVLEKRTYDLLQCMERRQAESPDGSIDLTECFYHWSYDFMGDMVFGGANKLELMKNGDPQNLIMGGKMAIVIVDSIGQTPWLMDLIWHLPVGGAVHRMLLLGAQMVHTRLQVKEQAPYRDLMSYLTADGKIHVDDLELDAVIAILGGSDNTSITMALAVFFLTTEPRYYEQLRAEVAAAFPDPNAPLEHDTLQQLPLLEGVVMEALRLGSPYFLPRVVPAPGAHIDGRFIPPGTVVALAAYSQQTDPANFYPDPLSFRPERWLPHGLGPETRANKAAIASFSFGPHACIAKALAYQEMRYVLARLVLTMDISPVVAFDARAFREGILNMRTTVLEEHLMVRVHRRPGVRIEGFLH